MRLKSPAFEDGKRMPDKYTCKGEEVSPPLSWSDSPEGTASFALIAEDLDTPIGAITHWVVYNIPAEQSELPEALPRVKDLGNGIRQGRNGVWRMGYMGPCPPWGEHRYLFRIYALDTLLNEKVGSKRGLMKASEGHVLAQSELIGVYSKRS
jgi:Raf kinase inhibitor-like YbhB/YbcL family protein